MERTVRKALPSLKPSEMDKLLEMFKDLGVESDDDLKYLTPADISVLKPIQARRLLDYAKNVDKDTNDLDLNESISTASENGSDFGSVASRKKINPYIPPFKRSPNKENEEFRYKPYHGAYEVENIPPVAKTVSRFEKCPSRQNEQYQYKPYRDPYEVEESPTRHTNYGQGRRHMRPTRDNDYFQDNEYYEDDDNDRFGYESYGASNNSSYEQSGRNMTYESPVRQGPRIGRLRANNNTINNECNILILGETGVGKSTFINSFANYLTYSSLDEAEQRDLISLIPTTFTVTDSDYKERHIKFGTDPNESGKPGSSQTQGCRNYEFEVGDITVRLIDTPGIGDTGGIDQDTANFKKIISHISNFSVLNGILILLKPNNARLTVLFRFCIQELLAHLHKSASHNIIFLFTNARSTFYRPGDTLPSLRDMLEKTAKTPPHVEIKLDLNTIYCLDNEAFRFLVALKSNVSFNDKEKKNFAESWDKSVEECQRLMEYIISLSPHTIDDTISLYEAKQIVLLLARPLCDISLIIQTNIDLAKDQERRIKAAGDDIKKLNEALYYDYVDLEPVYFNEPRTVCTSEGCVTVRTLSDRTVSDYTTVCHDPCYLQNVEKERTNTEALRNCAAMNGTAQCVKCKCGYEKHMHIYYKNVEKTGKKIDSNIEKEITDKEQAKQQQIQALKECKERQAKLMKEQDIITNASAQIAHFLGANAIIMHNDATMDYLQHLLVVEKQKSALDPSNQKQVEHLKRIMQEYEQQCKIIERSLKTAKDPKLIFTPQMIRDLQKKLFSMELNGAYIRKAVEGQLNGLQKERNHFSKANAIKPPPPPRRTQVTYQTRILGFFK